MSIVRIFAAVVLGSLAGVAAGIMFVFACAAAVGTGADVGSPEWVKQISDFVWLAPLLGGVLGVVAAILIARRGGKARD